jgi:hypothetical protein
MSGSVPRGIATSAAPDVDAGERRWGYADNRVGHAVDCQRSANYAACAAESTLPEGATDNRDWTVHLRRDGRPPASMSCRGSPARRASQSSPARPDARQTRPPRCARLNRVDDRERAVKERLPGPIASQMGFVQAVRLTSPTIARRCGSLTGKARRSRLSIIEKIAVFAPIPSARERTATAVTTGDAPSDLNASRTSRMPSSTWSGLKVGLSNEGETDPESTVRYTRAPRWPQRVTE